MITDGVKCSLDIVGNYEEDYADQIKNMSQKVGFTIVVSKDVRPFIENVTALFYRLGMREWQILILNVLHLEDLL